MASISTCLKNLAQIDRDPKFFYKTCKSFSSGLLVHAIDHHAIYGFGKLVICWPYPAAWSTDATTNCCCCLWEKGVLITCIGAPPGSWSSASDWIATISNFTLFRRLSYVDIFWHPRTLFSLKLDKNLDFTQIRKLNLEDAYGAGFGWAGLGAPWRNSCERWNESKTKRCIEIGWMIFLLLSWSI